MYFFLSSLFVVVVVFCCGIIYSVIGYEGNERSQHLFYPSLMLPEKFHFPRVSGTDHKKFAFPHQQRFFLSFDG